MMKRSTGGRLLVALLLFTLVLSSVFLLAPDLINAKSQAQASSTGITDPVITGVVKRNANLRAGPGVQFNRVGAVMANQKVIIVGVSAVGDWYQLSSGAWIAAFLVEDLSGPTPQAPVTPLPLATPSATPTIRRALPISSEWSAATDFGTMIITIAPGSVLITKIAYKFVNWQCGSMQLSGGVSSSKVTGGWPITNGKFTIDNNFDGLGLTIEGMFDAQSGRATGTWQVSSPDPVCSGQSGVWEAHQSTDGSSSPSMTPVPAITVPMFSIPTITVPVFSIPTISMPVFSIPTISMPVFSIPTVNIPAIHVPPINVPATSTAAIASPTITAESDAGRPVTRLIRSVFNKKGKGKLTIGNGTDSDGMVVLVTLGGQSITGAYIRTNEEIYIPEIPDGEYRLFFTKGSAWDDASQKFKVAPTYQVFDDILTFMTTATQYTIWEVTLYGTSDGRATTTDIPADAFPKLK